jgi:hypothetical protein
MTTETTTNQTREVSMSEFSTIQAGLLPIGTTLPGFGTIIDVSLTAYKVEWTEPCSYGTQRRSEWLAFHHVHGRPAAASPLVVFA